MKLIRVKQFSRYNGSPHHRVWLDGEIEYTVPLLLQPELELMFFSCLSASLSTGRRLWVACRMISYAEPAIMGGKTSEAPQVVFVIRAISLRSLPMSHRRHGEWENPIYELPVVTRMPSYRGVKLLV